MSAEQGTSERRARVVPRLEGVGVPLDRVASVAVSGLGGDTKTGPSTRKVQAEKLPGQTGWEFRGGDLPSALGGTLVF